MNFSGFHYKILFERVFDPIALYKIGEDKIVFVDVNPAYEKIMKVAREDVTGKTFHEVWPDAEALWSRVIRECLKQKKTMHCIGESVDAGSYLEAIAFPIPPEMAAVIFLDRTKLKRSNNSLKNRQNQLRALAAQLTISEENTRRSIASDLHDRVGYDLISQLKILRHIQKLNGSENIEDLIQVLIDNTEKMISENRDLIFELSPLVLKDDEKNAARMLSGREREVLRLLAEGKNTKEIGYELSISKNTVDVHRRHIMEKTGCSTVASLVRYAIREGY